MTYLGAPKDARYYKSSEFDGRFDGGVDPISGVVTLYFRVKFDVAPVTIDGTHPGTAEWFKAAEKYVGVHRDEVRARLQAGRRGGVVRQGDDQAGLPVRRGQSVPDKVVVSVVDSDQNETFFLTRREQKVARTRARRASATSRATTTRRKPVPIRLSTRQARSS